MIDPTWTHQLKGLACDLAQGENWESAEQLGESKGQS